MGGLDLGTFAPLLAALVGWFLFRLVLGLVARVVLTAVLVGLFIAFSQGLIGPGFPGAT